MNRFGERGNDEESGIGPHYNSVPIWSLVVECSPNKNQKGEIRKGLEWRRGKRWRGDSCVLMVFGLFELAVM